MKCLSLPFWCLSNATHPWRRNLELTQNSKRDKCHRRSMCVKCDKSVCVIFHFSQLFSFEFVWKSKSLFELYKTNNECFLNRAIEQIFHSVKSGLLHSFAGVSFNRTIISSTPWNIWTITLINIHHFYINKIEKHILILSLRVTTGCGDVGVV